MIAFFALILPLNKPISLEQPVIKTNFTAGEFSQKLFGRSDVTRYANGAAVIENFLINEAGGIFSRPGTRYVAEAKTSFFMLAPFLV